MHFDIPNNIFVCLFIVHNIINLKRHEQVCLMRLRFERYFPHHRDCKQKICNQIIDKIKKYDSQFFLQFGKSLYGKVVY